MNTIILDGQTLSLEAVVEVARNFKIAEISQPCRDEIIRVRQYIEDNWMTSEAPPTYGFNTGVGKLKYLNINMDQNDTFQNNLILSHCGGVGEPASEEVVRATMVVRLNAFCQGVSGLRIEVIDRLLAMLNQRVHPVIPIQGSVGASGDLAPLAHMVATLVGLPQAEAYYQGERLPAPEALKRAGITPISYQLKAKDCLALINGTTMFAGMAALNCYDANRLAKEAEISGALSLEAVRGEMGAFDDRIHQVRRQKGQIDSASNIRFLVAGSERTTEKSREMHLPHDVLNPEYKPRIQDVYSLRCLPQVQGAVRDNLAYASSLLEKEINAATDNPLVFWNEAEELEFLSGGNFHGEPIAFAMDILAMSVTELGNISERRSFNMLDPTLSYGLPPNLAGEPAGLNYGYGIIACAASAIVSENKTLCFPASVDNVSTKSNQEDHVSMAPWATRKAKSVIDNVRKVLGIECMLAAEAISLTEPQLGQFKLGNGTQAAFDCIRRELKPAFQDSYMPHQSEPVIQLIENGSILDCVEKTIGSMR